MICVCLKAISEEAVQQNIPPGLWLLLEQREKVAEKCPWAGCRQEGEKGQGKRIWLCKCLLAWPCPLLSALALLLSHRICHSGCALGIQLVSPSVLPAQGYKTLQVITGSYLFLKSLGARGEISFIYIKIALECIIRN